MTVREANKYEKFFGKDWAHVLSPFLASSRYYQIGAELKRQKEEGIDITPGFENIFRAFKECPMYKLHSVIIGQDVYPGKNKDGTFVADGIAFSANQCAKAPASLNSIQEAIDTSVYNGEYMPVATYNHERDEATWDLKYLANDGMLLINCAYTTIAGRPNEHIPLWKPFTEFLISTLNEKRDGLGIIMMGSQARSHKGLITNPTHVVFECEHPAAAMYKKRKWEHNDVFAALTDYQKRTNNITINW